VAPKWPARRLGLGGFAAARALSTRNDDPEEASRPWDKDRDGFVLGDGAGVLVLEEYEHAKARGAASMRAVRLRHERRCLPHDRALRGRRGAPRCMALALRDAGINPEEVDYINAHGTSTPAGRCGRDQGHEAAFGDHAYRWRSVPPSP
jgi:3-oxoacyl-[acyl-carrier-protein] synthase II